MYSSAGPLRRFFGEERYLSISKDPPGGFAKEACNRRESVLPIYLQCAAGTVANGHVSSPVTRNFVFYLRHRQPSSLRVKGMHTAQHIGACKYQVRGHVRHVKWGRIFHGTTRRAAFLHRRPRPIYWDRDVFCVIHKGWSNLIFLCHRAAGRFRRLGTTRRVRGDHQLVRWCRQTFLRRDFNCRDLLPFSIEGLHRVAIYLNHRTCHLCHVDRRLLIMPTRATRRSHVQLATRHRRFVGARSSNLDTVNRCRASNFQAFTYDVVLRQATRRLRATQRKGLCYDRHTRRDELSNPIAARRADGFAIPRHGIRSFICHGTPPAVSVAYERLATFRGSLLLRRLGCYVQH